MSLICDEPFPGRPEIRCDHRPGNHPQHSGLDLSVDPPGYVDWNNPAYVAPPRKDTERVGPTLSRLGVHIRAARHQ
jgi:hypothetical protein